jgi:hypothetical protein
MTSAKSRSLSASPQDLAGGRGEARRG